MLTEVANILSSIPALILSVDAISTHGVDIGAEVPSLYTLNKDPAPPGKYTLVKLTLLVPVVD